MRITQECARRYYRAIDTPRSLSCYMLMEYGEWDQLATQRVDPSQYLDWEAYYLDVLAVDFLRKHASLPCTFDRRLTAMTKYMEAERACTKANVTFSRLNSRHFADTDEMRIDSFCRSVKREVSEVLGRVPNEVHPRFGPGATVGDRGRYTTVVDKMVSVPTITPEATILLELWKHSAWGREYLRRTEKRGLIRPVDFGRFVTVPKDAKTDRSIEIQPSINVFYQLGVGAAMRSGLKRWGIDLDNGQALHRQVAAYASETGQYSTIDLSSASDTISKEVVKALLPNDWYELLDTLRTRKSLMPHGKKLLLSKFSAMGNGYTFELETLIFASLVRGTLHELGLPKRPGRDFWVYGDDIIVPSCATRAVLAVLKYFGFTPNASKTFSTGQFRESCGGDFFGGRPVRPHYLKDEPNEPHDLISLANGLRRCWIRLEDGRRRARLVAVWHWVLDQVPSDLRGLRGPESLGDIVVHDDRHWKTRPSRGDPHHQMEIRCWVPIPAVWPLSHWPVWAQFAGALYGVDSGGISNRGDIAGFRTRWVSLLEREETSRLWNKAPPI
jgi:hypothetical protein